EGDRLESRKELTQGLPDVQSGAEAADEQERLPASFYRDPQAQPLDREELGGVGRPHTGAFIRGRTAPVRRRGVGSGVYRGSPAPGVRPPSGPPATRASDPTSSRRARL